MRNYVMDSILDELFSDYFSCRYDALDLSKEP